MTRGLTTPVRLLFALAATLAVALPAVPAMGQTTTGTTTQTTTQMSIDSPTANASVSVGNQIDIGGWAADPAGPGAGVDIVRVYLDNRMESGGTLLGDANYGNARPDVAAALGNAALTNSGFNLLWTPTNVSAGQHTLYVYAHSLANSWAFKTVTISVQAAPTPTPRRGPYGGGPYDNGYGYGNGYPGQYGPGMSPMFPPPGMYPPYPGGGYYPPPPSDGGGRVCIMIYPPPPGC